MKDAEKIPKGVTNMKWRAYRADVARRERAKKFLKLYARHEAGESTRGIARAERRQRPNLVRMFQEIRNDRELHGESKYDIWARREPIKPRPKIKRSDLIEDAALELVRRLVGTNAEHLKEFKELRAALGMKDQKIDYAE